MSFDRCYGFLISRRSRRGNAWHHFFPIYPNQKCKCVLPHGCTLWYQNLGKCDQKKTLLRSEVTQIRPKTGQTEPGSGLRAHPGPGRDFLDFFLKIRGPFGTSKITCLGTRTQKNDVCWHSCFWNAFLMDFRSENVPNFVVFWVCEHPRSIVNSSKNWGFHDFERDCFQSLSRAPPRTAFGVLFGV